MFGRVALPRLSCAAGGQSLPWDNLDFLVYPGMRAGLFFIFDARDGHLARTVSLYDMVGEEQYKNSRFGWVVVGYQPMPDGRVLVAARSEAAMFDYEPVHLPLNLSSADYEKVFPDLQKKLNANLATYPALNWFTIDPLSGEKRAEAAPRKFPNTISTQQEFQNYRFRFKADGNLTLKVYEEESPESSASKDKSNRRSKN